MLASSQSEDTAVPIERWVPIAEFEGLYEVSDQGRVRSLTRCIPFLWEGSPRQMQKRGRVLRPGNVGGYLQVQLTSIDHAVSQRKVHQLVLEAFVGPCPDGEESRHLNGTRGDCRLENLCWGTKLENAHDKRVHGTMCRGERHGRHKLTTDDVVAIRSSTDRQIDLAAQYGVGQGRISAIILRHIWKHVP